MLSAPTCHAERSEASPLPRVLIVSDGRLNLAYGAGVTIANLFKGWPHASIGQLYATEHGPADRATCDISWRYPSFAWCRPPFSLWLSKLICSIIILTMPRALLCRLSLLLCPGVSSITRFRPEVIYCFPQTMESLLLAWALSRRYRVGWLLHIMDDWPGAVPRHAGLLGRALGLALRPFVNAAVRKLAAGASSAYGISGMMADEYSRRYHRSFGILANCIDEGQWSRPKVRHRACGPFVIRYIGALLSGQQLPGFEDICKAVEDLAAGGMHLRLELYGPRSTHLHATDYGPGHVVWLGPKPHADVPELLAGADLLVLSVTFDPIALEYTRFSMPTKIPEYMASGTPVLIYGPRSCAPVQYAMESGWGHVVTSKSVADLKAAICNLLADVDLRASYGRAARDLALNEHVSSAVRGPFWADIVASVRRSVV